MLFAAVNVARKLQVDPELALRAASDRFRARVTAASELAASEGRSWNDLAPDEQLAYYARARLSEGGPEPDMSQIEHVHARQILDSRGNPDGRGRAQRALRAPGDARRCPSGASTGEFEATELRDGGSDWMGKGVTQGGRERQRRDRDRRPRSGRSSQAALDRMLIALDGTPNKSRLGANAILAVSLAAAHAAAAEERLPLWRYLGGETRARAAGADDERPQRRRPRRQRGRLPGVHDRAGRRADVRRGAADGRRGVPPPQEDAPRRRALAPRSATRAASRPTSAPTRRRSRC